MSEAELAGPDGCQPPAEEKVKQGLVIIDNDGSVADLKAKWKNYGARFIIVENKENI